MSIITRTSLTALALIASTAAVSQTTVAADRSCKDTRAPSALSAQLKASTFRTAALAQRVPAGRLAKPCDDKRTAVQKAPAPLQVKPVQPTRLKVKLKKKIGKKVLTATTARGTSAGKTIGQKAPPPPPPPGIKSIGTTPPPPGGPVFTPEAGGDGTPIFIQTGGHTAYVPMVHAAASCDMGNPDCLTHYIANQNGNMTVSGIVSVQCPEGQNLTYLNAYVYSDAPVENHAPYPSVQSLSVPVEIEPWEWSAFNSAGWEALGEYWIGGEPDPQQTAPTVQFGHPDVSPTVQVEMTKTVTARAICGGVDHKAEYQIKTMVTIHDLDAPAVGPGVAQSKDLAN